MDRYIEQLLEDFIESEKKVPDPDAIWDSVDKKDAGEVEDMAYAEQVIYGTPQRLSDIVHIEQIQLPPAERLSDVQISFLYNGMVKLLAAYHFIPDFPDGLPEKIRYPLLREKWESEQVFVGAGEVHLEFCQFESKQCPFPDAFCECKQFEKEMEADNDHNESTETNYDDFLPLM